MKAKIQQSGNEAKIRERLKYVMLTVQHIYRDDVIYQIV